MTHRRPTPCSSRLVACVMTAAMLALVGGCGTEKPRPVVTPEVRWADTEPYGDIEADPWVRAVRAAELAHATALNNANYADTEMLTTWREDHVHRFARRAARRLDRGDAYVLLGPPPFTPISVEVDPSGDRAVVRGCADRLDTRPAIEQGPGPWPQAYAYHVERGPDGYRRIVSSSEEPKPYSLANGDVLTDEYCTTVQIPHGTFDPVPDLEVLQALRGRDVVAPPRPGPTFTTRALQ